MGEWMRLLSLIAVAGVLGTLARFGVGSWLNGLTPSFPWGTLAVNVVGAFVLGFVFAGSEGDAARISAESRRIVAIGFCGAFTTFSAYALDTVVLAERGTWALAVVNVAANNVLSIGALFGGLALGRAL
jgi:CrcB protein